jgi:hypothetical protein
MSWIACSERAGRAGRPLAIGDKLHERNKGADRQAEVNRRELLRPMEPI